MKLKYIFYFTCLLLTCFAFFLQVSPEVESSYIALSLHIPQARVIDYTSLFLAAYAIMQVPNGIILDRFGLRAFPFYIVIALLGMFIFWAIPNKTTLISREILTGFGSSIAFLAAVYVATQTFGMRYRALFIALASVSGSLGAILSTDAYESLIKSTSWSTSLLFLVLILCLILMIALVILPKVQFKKPGVINSNLLSNLKLIVSNKLVLSIYGYTFFTWMIMMSFAGYWDKAYFENVHHLSVYRALSITEMYWVAYMIFSVVMSFYAKSREDCFLMIKVLSTINIIALIILVFPVLFSDSIVYTLAILCGASTAGITLGFSIISMSINYTALGLAASINNCILVLGGFFGQLLYGFIIHKIPNQPINVLDHTSLIENFYFALFILPIAAIIASIIIHTGIHHYKNFKAQSI